MKKYLFLASALMLCACSGNKTQEPAAENVQAAEPVEVATPSEDEIKADISARVAAIYAETLSSMDEAGMIKKYCSTAFSQTYADYQKAIEGAIGDIDYNLWSMAQDVSDPKVDVSAITLNEAEKADATIALTNFGNTQSIILSLVKEEGEWKIDDFKNPASVKEVLLANIKAFAEN